MAASATRTSARLPEAKNLPTALDKALARTDGPTLIEVMVKS